MTAPTPRGERPALRTLLPLPALTAVVALAAVAALVSAAPASARAPLAWGTGGAAVVLVIAVFLAVRAARTARIARQRLQSVQQDADRLRQEHGRLSMEAQRERQHLIDELARQRAEFAESLAREKARVEEESARELRRLKDEGARLAEELERARRARDAAISATSSAAGRMQALTTAMLADLRAMEERHTDEQVLADLLHLDHRTAQAGRRADSVAVLTGARSGRRWARPIPMESILRGAMGRIGAYRRVRGHAPSGAAVAGHAAEGVMRARAEILDTAATFSPPTSEVHVYVEEVPAGIIVSVEDSGLVMGEVQLRRAERAVSGDVSELGGLTGTRLGLAVVGRLARKYGLKVSFRPSARGGTGVLMLLPQDILTAPATAPGQPARTAASEDTDVPARSGKRGEELPPAPAPAPEPVHDSTPDGTDGDTAERAAGLPRRRRGRTLAEAERARAAARTPAPRTASGPQDAKARVARFSSFRRAVRAPGAEHAAPPGAAGERPAAEGDAAPPADAARPSSHPYAHPEGDTTS
ncbi:sensor histidine kinase [Streptomyces mexicanus]|uniref:sensor histidine kinase n=1 Tax=Streptomyces mexicanus TaxID=178566 RepID=UPI00135BACD9|nr:ATP-binding protein [Streptomyces mexicanus]